MADPMPLDAPPPPEPVAPPPDDDLIKVTSGPVGPAPGEPGGPIGPAPGPVGIAAEKFDQFQAAGSVDDFLGLLANENLDDLVANIAPEQAEAILSKYGNDPKFLAYIGAPAGPAPTDDTVNDVVTIVGTDSVTSGG